jgi:hypothetical protein
VDRGRRNPVPQVSETYAVAIVAQRHGIDPEELAERLEVNRLASEQATAGLEPEDDAPTPPIPYRDIVMGVPDWELVAEVARVIGRSGWAFWKRVGIALDGRTDRNHSGYGWERLGPHGAHRLDLFLFLLTLGLVASLAMPSAPTNDDHGHDADDRGPPSQRDVPLLTAAPSAPPAQAGHPLLLA